MNKRIFSVLIIVFLMAVGVSGVLTYTCLKRMACHHPSEEMTIPKTMQALSGLNLSLEQKKQLEAFESDLKKNMNDIQIKLANERITLCSLMNSSTSTLKDLNPSIDRVSVLEAEQHRLVVQHLLSVRDILTDEQRTAFFAAMMQDICQGCRKMCGVDKDMCGHCDSHKG